MISKEDYTIFQQTLESILDDTFIEKPTKEDFESNKYFFQQGLWSGTEDGFYFYDRQKLELHRQTLLMMCKKLRKYHKPSNDHAGTILSFETLPPQEIFANSSESDTHYYLALSNHFANLLCATRIAQVSKVNADGISAFLIVLNPSYRSYFE